MFILDHHCLFSVVSRMYDTSSLSDTRRVTTYTQDRIGRTNGCVRDQYIERGWFASRYRAPGPVVAFISRSSRRSIENRQGPCLDDDDPHSQHPPLPYPCLYLPAGRVLLRSSTGRMKNGLGPEREDEATGCMQVGTPSALHVAR